MGRERLAMGRERLAMGRERLAMGRERLAMGRERLAMRRERLARLACSAVINAVKSSRSAGETAARRAASNSSMLFGDLSRLRPNCRGRRICSVSPVSPPTATPSAAPAAAPPTPTPTAPSPFGPLLLCRPLALPLWRPLAKLLPPLAALSPFSPPLVSSASPPECTDAHCE